MAGNPYLWSTTALTNQSVDPDINFAEGQLPGTLNDSARGLMAGIAGLLGDYGATITTGGTGAAYTFASGIPGLTLATGKLIRFKANVVNTGACTLNVTPSGGAALGAKAIRVFEKEAGERDPLAGEIAANGHYVVVYDTAANGAAGAWVLQAPSDVSTNTRTLPGGRLTLTTATPVLIANVTAQGTVYYTPYIHDLIPLYDGAVWRPIAFTEQNVVLDSTNFLNGKVYDFFMFLNSGTPTLGYGPAWTNITTRSGAVSRLNGMWTNTASMTIRTSSSTTFNVGANQALLIGSAYATANGQTGMNFTPAAAAGGNNNILGIFNVYNRLPFQAFSRDNTSTWTYATSTWRAANGNANNAINYLDGLGEVSVNAVYNVSMGEGAGVTGAIGINLNSTSATPTFQAAQIGVPEAATVVNSTFLPALGFNTVNAVEFAGAATVSFWGTGTGQGVGQTQMLSVLLSI